METNNDQSNIPECPQVVSFDLRPKLKWYDIISSTTVDNTMKFMTTTKLGKVAIYGRWDKSIYIMSADGVCEKKISHEFKQIVFNSLISTENNEFWLVDEDSYPDPNESGNFPPYCVRGPTMINKYTLAKLDENGKCVRKIDISKYFRRQICMLPNEEFAISNYDKVYIIDINGNLRRVIDTEINEPKLLCMLKDELAIMDSINIKVFSLDKFELVKVINDPRGIYNGMNSHRDNRCMFLHNFTKKYLVILQANEILIYDLNGEFVKRLRTPYDYTTISGIGELSDGRIISYHDAGGRIKGSKEDSDEVITKEFYIY